MGRWLLVGLGNPGPEYARTRHNVGFRVVDELARRWDVDMGRKRFGGRFASGLVAGQACSLLQPLTYMNLSGRSVGPAVGFLRIEHDRLLIIHDEIDLPFGALRVKKGGGHGGHNGLRSLHQCLGTSDYLRLRVGVGRPEHGDVTNHVLGRFREPELRDLDDLLTQGADAVELILREGFASAMNRYNGSGKKKTRRSKAKESIPVTEGRSGRDEDPQLRRAPQ